MTEALQEATSQGWLDFDATNGPNPIGTRLLELWPEGGEVRRLFGLGNRENLVEPSEVYDPLVLAVEADGDPFPFRASARAERFYREPPAIPPSLVEEARTEVLPGLVTRTPTISLPVITRSRKVNP